jgi:hypothetical protein
MEIYLLQGGEQTGPFTVEEVRGHLASGRILNDLPAWREGMDTWAPVHEVVPIPNEEPIAPLHEQQVAPAKGSDFISISIPRTKFIWIGYACGALLLLFVFYYVASPYYALHVLKYAILNGDRDALESHIDFPALRDSLKEELKAQMTKNMSHDTGMFSGLAEIMAPSIIDNQIDSFVTPAGLVNVIDPIKKDADTAQVNATTDGASPVRTNPFQVTKAWFDSPTDFVFTILQSKVHMRFYRFGWKVYALEMADYSSIGAAVAPVSTSVAAGPDSSKVDSEPPDPHSEAFQSMIIQQARTIGLWMFTYSVDHNGAYPDGKTSTEIFQKLIDGKYADNPAEFYFPMDGKTKPTSSKLKPENVCFDATAGATVGSPDSLPLVYSTGYVISYVAGDNALPIDRTKVPWAGIGVVTKGNQANFIQADETGTVPNLTPPAFNPEKRIYQQVTPDVAPQPSPQYVALDQKNGFQKYTLGMAQTSLNPNDVDEGYATPDGYSYEVKQFDKQIGSAEIKDVRLYFSEGLLKEPTFPR